jgi:SAM-dependent methyltransferase
VTETFQVAGNAAWAYEELLVPAFFAACAEQLLDLATPRPGERVLDLACGTGVVARRARPAVGSSGNVVAVDLNESMLEVARDVDPEIDWRQGDAAAIPLPDGSVDLVCCQHGLQFCADQPQVLREMHRVLAPGGRAALATWRELDQHPVFERLVESLGRHVGAEAASMMRGPFAGPARSELRALATGAGFRDCRVRIGVVVARFDSTLEFLRHEVASTPLAQPVGDLDDDRRAALINDVEYALADFVDDDGLVVVLPTWLAIASR